MPTTPNPTPVSTETAALFAEADTALERYDATFKRLKDSVNEGKALLSLLAIADELPTE